MASESDNNQPNPATEQGTAAVANQQDVKQEAAKPASPPSVFVNSEPMREEQVQNAVKFLSHPKVRGSPVIYRRSFLEKKGLTKEEIDEAFSRVPDPQPSAQAASTSQDGAVRSSSNVQPQAAPQTLQVAAAAPANVVSKRYQFHWSHALYAIGILGVTGAGTAVLLKNSIIPRLKSWVRKVVLEEDNETSKEGKPTLAEEAAAAAKAAAAAAADVAKASQEMLNTKNQEKRYFEELTNMLDVQVREMRSMSNSIRKLEGQSNTYGRTTPIDQDYRSVSVTNTKQPHLNGRSEFDMRSVRSSSPPTPVEPAVPPHPKSYMEIMAMVQRGEKPSNIRDIDDSPPNPYQQPSNSRMAPLTKPWQLGATQSTSTQGLQSQSSTEDIHSMVQDNGLLKQSNGDSSVHRQQRISARITEVDPEEELNAGTYVPATEQPIRRAWVPPQPPPVVMAEAAEAIRRPKPPVQKEQVTDDELMARSSGATDELERVTKISEAGGPADINEGNYELNSHQVQEEQVGSHEGN